MSPLAFLWVFPTYLNKGEEGETRGSQWKMNTRGTSLLSKGTETIFALRSGKKETGPKKGSQRHHPPASPTRQPPVTHVAQSRGFPGPGKKGKAGKPPCEPSSPVNPGLQSAGGLVRGWFKNLS